MLTGWMFTNQKQLHFLFHLFTFRLSSFNVEVYENITVENEVISQKRRPCFHLNLLECCLTLTAKKAILSSPWLPVKRRAFWSSIQLTKLNYFTWTKNGTALSWQMFSKTNYLVPKHFQVLILNQICKYNAGKAFQWYLGFFFMGNFIYFVIFERKLLTIYWKMYILYPHH